MPAKPNKNYALYCPNATCPNHTFLKNEEDYDRRFLRRGFFQPRMRERRLQRFQCRLCRKTFSETFPLLEYRIQRRGYFEKVFLLFKDGLSNRQIGRFLNLSESVVRSQLKRLCQQSLLQHQLRSGSQVITESIAYDGVENFAKSQYEPNYINQAIGMKSGFIYDFNFSPLNRKGKMSDRQRLKNLAIQNDLGKFPRESIRVATTKLIGRLCERCPSTQTLTLCSDEHYMYRPAIKIDLCKYSIEHKTVSAKAPRVFRHILFQVNHTDLLLRQHVKAFARETISFSKSHSAMVLKYGLFMVWKNYMRSQFVKKHKRNPSSNTQSPAMALGIERSILEFNAFFGQRLAVTQTNLSDDWLKFLSDQVPFPRKLKE